MKSLPFLLIFTLLLLCKPAYAQQQDRPLLERSITLNAKNETIKSIFNQLEKQAGFTFSYPSRLINTEKRTSLQVQKKTVREVLYLLFENQFSCKARGHYLILSETPEKVIVKPVTSFVLSGYVSDAMTGDKISAVSIYEGSKMISTITNQYGYFSLKISDPKVQLNLKVSKQHYRDTLVTITNRGNQRLAIAIHPETKETSADTSRAEPRTSLEFMVPEESAVNTQNITDTLYKKYQFSLLPGLGTNYKLGGNVINEYSFNLLGGYSLGTTKAELAGLFNIDRGDVKYVQLAGLANGVGGNFEGVQASGYLNLVRRNLTGIQLSGFGNLVWDSVYGVQAAGFFNFNRGYSKSVQLAGFLNANLDTSQGVQLAGFLNTTLRTFNGVQVAGFTNAAIQETKGVQAAGFLNTCVKDMKGVQAAGFGNVAVKNFYGVQVAGFFNSVVQEMRGTQVSLFLNYACKIKGNQIGLINISDSCTGIPVGLLSFVKSGYHRLEFSADEIFYLNTSLRSGTTSFHNILFAGIRPENQDTNLWTFGYGVGTAIRLGKSTLLDLDLTSQHINFGSVGPKINLLSKFYIGLEQRLAKGFHLSTGPVCNIQLTNNNYHHYPEIFIDSHPNIFYKENFYPSSKIRMWFGWKFGIRFF